MNPKVTISVAVYNGAEHIERLARSLFGQTLEEMEFLFVDDKSSDDSIAIVQKVLKEYPNRVSQTRFVFHEKNMGIAKTKRDCFLMSKGQYVIVVDEDDYLDERMAELLYDKAVQEDADMVVSDFYYYKFNRRNYVNFVSQKCKKDTEGIRNSILNRYSWPVIWCKLFKRSLFEENDFVWPVKNLGEDVLISAVTAYYAKHIAYVQEPLYHYFFYDTSWSNLITKDHCLSQFDSYLTNVNIMLEFLARKNALRQYDRGVFISKMRTKNKLLPILTDRSTTKLWMQTFPEAHRKAFFGTNYLKSTYREKIWITMIALGLFPYFRKRLNTHRFRPNQIVIS